MTTSYSLPETEAVLTGEELFASGDGDRLELVKGKPSPMTPTGYLHGLTESTLGSKLKMFVDQNGSGKVMVGEVGIYTGRNPDTVRAADILFISNRRMSRVKSTGYLDVAPELVVEIISPGDRWCDIVDKLDEYFSIGVQNVWLVDPRHKQVFVYTSPTEATRFSGEQTITGGDVLPGFETRVLELFE